MNISQSASPDLTKPVRLSGPNARFSRFGEPLKFAPGLYQLATDTYAWMVPNGSWGETNLGLINCKGSSVMIDTGWDLRCTQEMLDACERIILASPIDTVVNTHADGDHCWGNQLFAGRDIIATHACIHQMHHMHPRSLQALQHAGGWLKQMPFGGLGCFGHYMHEMLKPYDFGSVHITKPTLGFSKHKTLTVHGVDLIITEVGPGHTDGDAVVHVPSRRVAYAGDILFVGVTPVMWSGPIENLLAGLRFLLSLDVDVIVPGHGPLASNTDVQAVIDYWDFAREALFKLFKQGMPPDLAACTVVHSKAFARQPWARWDSPERLVTSAYTLYRHWGATMSKLPGQLATMDMLRRQAMLAFDLPDASPQVMHHR